MTSLLRFRPLVAVLVALTVFVTACGGDDDAVIAGADADTVIASLIQRRPACSTTSCPTAATPCLRIATVVESWLVANALELELAERGFPITDEDELAVAAVGEQDGNDTEIQIPIDTVAISYTVGRWMPRPPTSTNPTRRTISARTISSSRRNPAALERFEAGEAFADLAIELSTGPSGPSGGDLGCAVEGQFVPEFEEAAYAGVAGDVVGPVETTFGWHLIEIEASARPPSTTTPMPIRPSLHRLPSTCRGHGQPDDPRS